MRHNLTQGAGQISQLCSLLLCKLAEAGRAFCMCTSSSLRCSSMVLQFTGGSHTWDIKLKSDINNGLSEEGANAPKRATDYAQENV